MTAVRKIRIFISSPGDVAEERDRGKGVVEGLRKRYAGRLRLETVLWEDLPLTAGMSFQEGIDRVILSETYGVDVAVFILWSRLGSPLGEAITKPDGTQYRSGTERELDLMLAAYEQSGHERPQVIAYVRQDQDAFIEAQRGKKTDELGNAFRQRELVEEFIREEFHDPETGANLRAYHTFPTPATFAVRLRQHLRGLLDELAAQAGVPVDQQWEDDPYRGLQAFDVEHAPIFFGREEETGAVLEALQAQQRASCAFVLVVGASGSGKSSLVRAGVIPELIENGDHEGVSWRRAMVTPGECTRGLLPGLARALLAETAIPELREDEDSLQELAEDLTDAPKQAAKQVRRALQHTSTDSVQTNLVLLVDQFEELFTHSVFLELDVQAFVAALRALAECTRVSVLATVRSDYYGHCQQLADLAEIKSSAGQVDLVAPRPAALSRIIARPAQLAGLRFEEDSETRETLDQRILADIGNNPEALPLVEFLLTQLWENRSPEGLLTFAQYERLGGVEGAIGQHAEDVFKTLPDDVRAEFGSTFHALVTLDEIDDAQPVRRRAPIESVADAPARKLLVDALLQARLLTSDRGEITVAHEALLRRWDRAADWIAEHRDFLRIRAQVNQRRKQGGVILPGDPLYNFAKEALDRNRDWFDPATADFIDRAVRDAKRRERRAQRVRHVVIAGLSVLTALAVWQRHLAIRNATNAIAARHQKERLANDMASLAEKEASAREGVERQLYLSRIYRAAGDIESGRHVQAAALLRTIPLGQRGWEVHFLARQAAGTPLTLHGHRDYVTNVAISPDGRRTISGSYAADVDFITSVAFSPDGQRIISGSDDGAVKVWDASTGEETLTIRGNEYRVNSVAFSPDGRRVIGGSSDDTVKVWDAGNGAEVLTLRGHESIVTGVAFSSDGRRIVSGSYDNTLRVWDARTGEETLILRGHTAEVTSVASSPDGQRVISGSGDNTVKVWDASNGVEIFTFRGHRAKVTSVAFSPDGGCIVSGSDDNTVRVWDTSAGEQTLKIQGHEYGVTSVAFSPDGRRIVSGGHDDAVRVWDAVNGEGGRTLRGSESSVWSVAFSADGHRVVSGSDDNTVRVWDAATREQTVTFRGHDGTVTSLAFSPDGRRVVTGSDDRTVGVWNTSTGEQNLTLRGHLAEVNSVAFAPDGRRIVSGSDDNTVRVWDANSGQGLGMLPGHLAEVNSVAFAPDGHRIASGSDDRTVKVWDMSKGVVLTLCGHDAEVTNVVFSPDGQRVISGSDDHTVRIWDAQTGEHILTLREHESYVTSLAISPDGRRIVSGTEQNVRVWDASTGQVILIFRADEFAVTSLAFSPDGHRIISGSSDDRTVKLWNAQTGEHILTLRGHEGYVTSLAFSPDGRRIISGSEDTTARVWDARNGEECLTFRRPEECWVMRTAVAFDPNGRCIVGVTDDTVEVWDTNTGEQILKLRGHEAEVSSVAFSPDGRRIASGSEDTTIKIWDTRSGEEIITLHGHGTPVTRVAFSSGGGRIVSRDTDDNEIVWDASTGARVEGERRPATVAVSNASPVVWLFVVPFSGKVGLHRKTSCWDDLWVEDARRRTVWEPAWCERDARECEKAENWFAARFHLRRLAELKPGNESIQIRLKHAEAMLAVEAPGK